LSKFEKYLVIALLFLPLTTLRVGFIGIGELILIFLFVTTSHKFFRVYSRNYIINNYENKFIFSKFWIYFLILSIIGFYYNILILNHETGTFESFLFDFSAYIIIFLSCNSMEVYDKYKGIQFEKVFKAIFLCSSVLFGTLFLISMRMDNIFGFPLNYYDYFSPLSNNIHQTAMFLVPMPFIGLFVIEKEKRKYKKLIYLFLIISLVPVIIAIGSFKSVIGLVAGLFFYLFLKTSNSINKGIKFIIVLIIAFSSMLSILTNNQLLFSFLLQFFVDNDGGGGRAFLYEKGISLGMSSFLFGRGSGAHIFNGLKFYDAHQSFLTIFLQTGIFGLLLFVNLFYNLFKKIAKIPSLFAAFFTIVIYALGGDILRRLPIWILLILIYNYSTKSKKHQLE